MSLSDISPAAPSARPALDLIALARLSPDVARKSLRALLVANPGHFGNLSGNSFKAILKIENDTTYERLIGLGYNPRSERLRAALRIKQQTGYSAANSGGGSMEYVRFYLSYDGGRVWRDQGLRALNVFNNPDPAPHDYGVTLRIRPKEKLCSPQTLQRVRAVLSWNLPPPARTPDWTPVWGDVAEAEIEIEGSEFIMQETPHAPAEMELSPDETAALSLNRTMKSAGCENPLFTTVRIWQSLPQKVTGARSTIADSGCKQDASIAS
jgi:hypothetical protein